MEALIGLIGGIVGAILGAWCAVSFSRAASRRQTALNLLERYNSPDFFIARAETWKLIRDWKSGDHSLIDFFLNPNEKSGDFEIGEKCGNGLTTHQNLSWLLHFYANLARYCEAGLADKKLLRRLFRFNYTYYQAFVDEFIAEYKSRSQGYDSPQPPWVDGLLEWKTILIDD
jgi:hypothetical protein